MLRSHHTSNAQAELHFLPCCGLSLPLSSLSDILFFFFYNGSTGVVCTGTPQGLMCLPLIHWTCSPRCCIQRCRPKDFIYLTSFCKICSVINHAARMHWKWVAFPKGVKWISHQYPGLCCYQSFYRNITSYKLVTDYNTF